MGSSTCPSPTTTNMGPATSRLCPATHASLGARTESSPTSATMGPTGSSPFSTTAKLAAAPSAATTSTFEYVSQATHAHVPGPMANTRVAQQSPKPWQTPPNAGHHQASPSPPQQSNSYMAPPKSSSPINPMATVLIPSGSSYEMPAVRGKGADLFAKRQSRMEKFIVDSETVQANRESRTASPVASLPTEWKYSPNVRAPPPLAYNPIQSPSYPPAAVKQLPPSSPSAKAKAKKKEKPKPTPKPLNVIDVMRHQPYQLNSSLFTYGPAVEAAEKATANAASDPNPPMQNMPMQYEHMAPVQQPGPMNAPYPQQVYGMPPHPFMHDSQYQQAPMSAYAPPNPYQQQAPGGPYHQAYNPQYQQAPLLPPAYQPQSPQAPPPTHPYQPPSQAPYVPASNPPYQPAPYQPAEPPTPSTYTAPSTLIMSGPDSASGGSSNAVAAAPKPRFMAKKSSAQALGRNYSLSPPASRVSSVGRPQTSASLSPRPQARVSTAPPAGKQSAWLERHLKPPTPWEAASRHPLGLVDEAFSHRDLHQAIVSNVHLAVQRKMLPEPPADWTARVSYQPSPAATPRSGSFQSQSWSYARSRSQSRTPDAVSSVSLAPGRYYGSLPRQWQPQQRPAMDAHLMSSALSSEYRRPFAKPTFKAMYTSNTKWSCKR
ncbi:Synaptopodin-2 [Merluccius polli]|uniref:Synaptopodin-2 n=1 Tax=Merluccius polli TaxID=89951 RepID=A0AA47MZ18_MERPO|nr:Synaptopodin-2 [Merluccius polli]